MTATTTTSSIQELANELSLGGVMGALQRHFGRYELLHHWTQGEFHHDVVFRVAKMAPGPILVVATNCNGGVKEVLCFDEVPDESALWHWRCPDSEEFAGKLPPVLARATTTHWFDPCELLRPDARSELRAEFRERQPGGGWVMRPTSSPTPAPPDAGCKRRG